MKNDLDDIDELQRLELSCLEQADKCASAAAKSALRNLAADYRTAIDWIAGPDSFPDADRCSAASQPNPHQRRS
jgi:hypothetical protein